MVCTPAYPPTSPELPRTPGHGVEAIFGSKPLLDPPVALEGRRSRSNGHLADWATLPCLARMVDRPEPVIRLQGASCGDALVGAGA